jgi:Fe-S-cluster-containing dehydrogenase component
MICSRCLIACNEMNRFPNGEEKLAVECNEGVWRVLGADYGSIPHCERKFK